MLIFLCPPDGWRFLAKNRTKTKKQEPIFMARPCQGEAGLLSPSRKGLNARPTKTSQIPGHCCCYGLGIHPTDTLVPCARLILKGKRATKEKFGAVRIYNEAGPRLPSKTLFCPFYSSGKVKICVLDKGCWMVGSRLRGSLKAVGMDWTVGVERNPSKSWGTSSPISVEVGPSSSCLLLSLRSTALHLCSPWSPLLD